MIDTPGKECSPFTIKFDSDWFKENDIILAYDAKLRVIKSPKEKYKKWWFRVLNFLTFGRCFRRVWFYSVKIEN